MPQTMDQQDDDSAISVAMDGDSSLKEGPPASESQRGSTRSLSRETPPSVIRSTTSKASTPLAEFPQAQQSSTTLAALTDETPLNSVSSSGEASIASSSTPSLSMASTGAAESSMPETPSRWSASHLAYPPSTLEWYHPTIGTNDATQEDLEAAEQVEEAGSIVVDSDEVSTDAGYGSGSDSNTAASTSLASSVRDYAFENGRRYHKFREGRYNFPNDDVEQEREDMKHAMVKLLCQQLHFAPIGDNPQQVLDIGTGTGIWAIEMADQFESATVLGVDLSPIQPDWVPPNVKFMVDDIESPWLHPRNYFDYIHSRHTVMAIKDWPRLLRRALEHIRPGGWMELQEVHHCPMSANSTLQPTHPVAQYWSLINEGLGNLGVEFHIAAGGRLAAMMRDCGFVNVTERVLHVPLGTWPKNKVLKTAGLYWRTILLDGVQAIALGPLTRGCGWSREQVEVFLVQVRRAYHDNNPLLYMPLHIVYGQKPEHGY